MAATIPIAKVSALLIRTLAKPVSTKLKREAPHHPKLSAVSQFIGQQIHSITSRVNVTTAGYHSFICGDIYRMVLITTCFLQIQVCGREASARRGSPDERYPCRCHLGRTPLTDFMRN